MEIFGAWKVFSSVPLFIHSWDSSERLGFQRESTAEMRCSCSKNVWAWRKFKLIALTFCGEWNFSSYTLGGGGHHFRHHAGYSQCWCSIANLWERIHGAKVLFESSLSIRWDFVSIMKIYCDQLLAFVIFGELYWKWRLLYKVCHVIEKFWWIVFFLWNRAARWNKNLSGY